MNKKGPIVVIEDDSDDQLLLEMIFQKLAYPNQVIYFFDGQAALDYLEETNDEPFLILSDINMPKLDGFALREKLHNDARLKLKCIPYLFFHRRLINEPWLMRIAYRYKAFLLNL